MAASHKKVVVRAFEGPLAWGYLQPGGFVCDGKVDLLLPDGRAKLLELSGLKTIVYVRDFNLDDAVDPERIGKRAFAGRPRGEGLWLRLALRDGETLEGLASFDLGFIDALIEDRGLFVSPPDGRGNALRVFVPRTALRAVELLGMVTSPTKKAAMGEKALAKAMVEQLQAGLPFEPER